MILDVFRCSQLFLDVFSWVVNSMDNHPLWGHFSKDPQLITDILQRFSYVIKMCSDVLRCSQMFTDVFRCFQMFLDFLQIFYRCPLDVLQIFFRCSQDVFSMLRWVLWVWWILMIIANESMDFNDPKEFYDPRHSMIPVIRWTLIVHSLRRYLHLQWSCLF